MSTRRFFLAALLATVVSPAFAQADTPEAFLAAIYGRVTAGDGTGGGAPFTDKAGRAKVFVRDLVKIWDKADDEAEKTGEIGPIEFDPFTDSQDPQVRRFAVKTLGAAGEEAKLAVSLFRDRKAKAGEKPQVVLEFTLKREAGAWRIADIARKGGEMPWTLQEIFASYR